MRERPETTIPIRITSNAVLSAVVIALMRSLAKFMALFTGLVCRMVRIGWIASAICQGVKSPPFDLRFCFVMVRLAKALKVFRIPELEQVTPVRLNVVSYGRGSG